METGLYFSCQIATLPNNALDVVGFTLEEGLSTLFTLELNTASLDPSINVKDLLLKEASLTITVNGKEQRKICGIVAEAFRGEEGFRRTSFTFIIRPKLWLLTLTQDNRIFHFKSIPEILNIILQKHAVTFDSMLIDPHKEWEYTTQRNETDYAFFSRLAAEEGIVFWFEEDTVFYSDSRIGMMGGEKLSYNPHLQSARREPIINHIRYGAKLKPNEVHLKDYKFTHPDVSLDAKTKDIKNQAKFTIYDSYGRYDDDQVAKYYAKYRLEAYQVNSSSGEGQSNTILLMPGRMFTIADHPSDELNSNWQITKITHKGYLPQSVAEESSHGEQVASLTNSFTFIPGSVEWRAPFIPKPVVHGTETAMVVGPPGEEIHVNEYGQVKIHFHWNKYDAPDEKASCWVRVSQNWNGDGFGFLATPRIGQEVVVAYLNGDIDQPIIIGTTYNGKNSPPLDLPVAKTQMSIKSKTHKGQGFNELRFEDSNNQQGFFMHAQKDMTTDVLNNRTTNVKANHTESVGGNQNISVTLNQDTKISGNRTITIQGTDKTVAGGIMDIHAKGAITISSATSIRLDCGAAAIEIDAAGNINFICNKFNFYAETIGEITACDLVSINDEGAIAGTLKNSAVASTIDSELAVFAKK